MLKARGLDGPEKGHGKGKSAGSSLEVDRNNTARKRSAPFVTKNACVACRKKRARCDGTQPCGRCITHHEVKCHYDVSTRISKDAMRDEIEQLKSYKEASERVLGALASDESDEINSCIRNKVMDALKSGGNVDEISRYLEGEEDGMMGLKAWKGERSMDRVESKNSPLSVDGGVSYSTCSESRTPGSFPTLNYSGDPVFSSPATSIDSTARSTQRTVAPLRYDVTNWTTVTSDLALIENLMAYYFCWEYPIFASISKSEFLLDYYTGRRRYCSELLVNAILSVGHRYLAASSSPSSDRDPLAHSQCGPEVGAAFHAEAERLLAEETEPSLVTVQALGILSVREASLGRNSQSSGYSSASIRMAVEMGLHLPAPPGTNMLEVDARSSTFWGAFAIDQFWSLNIGRMPHISRSSISIEKPRIVPAEELENWGAYNNVMSVHHEAKQLSNVRSVCQAFASLTEITHDSQNLLYEPRDSVLSKKMLAVYTQYLDWYAELPPILRLGGNSTPSVLFAHIYYHFSLLLFFRPFLRLRFAHSSIVPRDICLEAATAISILVRAYRKLYTLRRTPSLFPYMIFAASIIHLVCTNDVVSDDVGKHSEKMDVDDISDAIGVRPLRISVQVVQDISDLNEMAACHDFARRARQILVRMAQNWDIAPPQELSAYPSCPPSPNMSNVINWKQVLEREGVFERQVGDRPAEGIPRSNSMNLFCPDLSELMPVQGAADELGTGSRRGGSEEATQSGMEKHETPFFSPFLAQQMPLVNIKREEGGRGWTF